MRYFAMVAAGASLWGCWSIFLRPAGLTGIQSALLALLAMSLPAPFLVRRGGLRDRRAILALIVLGLADAANVALFFAAMQRGPVAVAVLTHYLAPLLVALCAPWVARERRSLRALVGAPLTLAGLGLLIWRPGEALSGWTAVLGGASAFFYAAIIFASKEAARAFSPLGVTALHSVISVLLLLLVFGRGALPPALDVRVLLVLAGGLLCGVLGSILFNTGLRRIPISATGALTYLEPLTAAVVGWVIFHETLSPWSLLGGALVLVVGVWIATEPRTLDSPLPSISGTS